MDRKYRTPSSSPSITIIGDNFVSDYIYISFKRYSKFKSTYYETITDVNHKVDYIIDSTFNKSSQDKIISYSKENDIKKLVLLNHWKRNIENINGLTLIQAIIPDVYGNEHMSFYRPGIGNYYDTEVNYCTLICEGIRRIHESKIGFIHLTHISYSQDKLKFIFIENLYKSLEHILYSIQKTSEYEIYDDEKNTIYVLNVIKDIIEYKGTIIFDNTRSVYNKPIKRLDYRTDNRSLYYYIRKIYNNLIYNNERFIAD